MRLIKAFGSGILVLVVLAFFEWGTLTWIPTLIAIGVGVYVWRQLKPKEKTPQPPPEDDNLGGLG